MGIFNRKRSRNPFSSSDGRWIGQAETNEDRKQWFAKTYPWDLVDDYILESLLSRCGTDPLFEVFVFASIENKLVKRYIKLGQEGVDQCLVCSVISGMMVNLGAYASMKTISAMSKRNESKAKKYNRNAQNLLDASILLEPNQINGYIQMAQLKIHLNNYDAALKYARNGLEVVRELKSSNIPFEKSKHKTIRMAEKKLDAAENALSEIIETISR